MAKNIRVSVIGAVPLSISEGLDHDRAVDEMIQHWDRKIDQVLPDRPDLIVLPEACDRPRNYHDRKTLVEYYRRRQERILDSFAQVARNNRCYITYPTAREISDSSWRNSTVLIDRNGDIAGVYNKNHLTIGEMEYGILRGKDAPVFECDFGRVGCAICFDLNFDALREKYVYASPDLLVFSSMYHGGLMENYWAYSCRAYFAAAVAGLPSTIISPVGEVIARSTNYFDFVTATVNLDYCVAHLDHNWQRLRALKAKYGRRVNISDPGFLGSVLITSETDTVTVGEMISEFEIECVDDYFRRVIAYGRDRVEP